MANKVITDLDVEGDITVSGTVDGVDLGTLGTAAFTASTAYAASAHTHAASAVTSGTFTTARIPNLAASKITSGTFADARIAQSNVTQHQAALSIDYGQLTGAPTVPTIWTPDVYTLPTQTFTVDANYTYDATAAENGTTNSTRSTTETIRFNEAGTYEVSYNITLKSNDSSVRQNVNTYATLNGTGIVGSSAIVYLRLNNTNQSPYGSVNATFYVTVSTNDLLRLRQTTEDGSHNFSVWQKSTNLKSAISVRRIS